MAGLAFCFVTATTYISPVRVYLLTNRLCLENGGFDKEEEDDDDDGNGGRQGKRM
jgi:hypothetical protein